MHCSTAQPVWTSLCFLPWPAWDRTRSLQPVGWRAEGLSHVGSWEDSCVELLGPSSPAAQPGHVRAGVQGQDPSLGLYQGRGSKGAVMPEPLADLHLLCVALVGNASLAMPPLPPGMSTVVTPSALQLIGRRLAWKDVEGRSRTRGRRAGLAAGRPMPVLFHSRTGSTPCRVEGTVWGGSF